MPFPFLTIALFLGALAISILMKPKPEIENARPLGLGDFRFPTATEGRRVPLVFGRVKIDAPNVVWYGDFEQIAITQDVDVSMFETVEQIIGFKYRVGMQFALCLGPVDALKRIWINERKVFDGTAEHLDVIDIDRPNLFGGDDLGNGGIEAQLRFRSGTDDQTPSVYLSEHQIIGGNTPAYRGICYLAPTDIFGNMYVGNSSNIAPWAFEVERYPDGPADPGDKIVNGADANPSNVIYEILTNTDWGRGMDPADIDSSNFQSVAAILFDEGNGFSMLVDREIEAQELLTEVERQIDGRVIRDPETGKWIIVLARFDYVVDDLPEITTANRIRLEEFTRGSWEDTTNAVRVDFADRNDKYKETFALAQDMANVRIQDGKNTPVQSNYPGVKNATLANSIAWRDLRALSYPLAKASVIVDGSFWNTKIGGMVAFTDEGIGDGTINKLPMRVANVDLSGLVDNRGIQLDLIQDVFAFQAGAFSDPTNTEWEEPLDDLDPFPTDEQLAFEAPRAFTIRDPAGGGEPLDKAWCGGRRQGPEVGFRIVQRNSSGAPSGAFNDAGLSVGFMLIGELQSSLSVGSATPLSSLIVVPDPDTQDDIQDAFTEGATVSDLGVSLRHLIMVNDEFMLVQSQSTSGANVEFENVYRGACDSVQGNHSAGDKVYLVFNGGRLTDNTFDPTNNVEIKLLPKSVSDEVEEADATTISFTMANRYRRPYAPSKITLGGTAFDTSIALEHAGSDGEDFNVPVLLNRRDFRTLDEVASLLNDAEDIDPSFPAANSTTHEADVRNDPGGANTLLFTLPFASDPDAELLRIDILIATDGVLPTTLRLAARATHDFLPSVPFDSRYDLVHDFAVTSALTGLFNFGARDTNISSNTLPGGSTVTGTYNLTLSSAFSAGNVQASINGGLFVTVIAAGLTSGTLGVVAGDTVTLRHTSSDVGAKKHLTVDAPGGGLDGYMVLFV